MYVRKNPDICIMKICKKCKIDKPDNQYYACISTKDGLRGKCISCLNIKREDVIYVKNKICCNCKENKEVLLFSKNKLSKDGYGSRCKKCDSKKAYNYKENGRNYYLSNYGITNK